MGEAGLGRRAAEEVDEGYCLLARHSEGGGWNDSIIGVPSHSRLTRLNSSSVSLVGLLTVRCTVSG